MYGDPDPTSRKSVAVHHIAASLQSDETESAFPEPCAGIPQARDTGMLAKLGRDNDADEAAYAPCRRAFGYAMGARICGEGGARRAARLENAEATLESIKDRVEPEAWAVLWEAKGDTERAIEEFIAAGRHSLAARVCRNDGTWERARTLTTGKVRDDMEWLCELTRTIAEMPPKPTRRLKPAEPARLGRLIDAVMSINERKRAQN